MCMVFRDNAPQTCHAFSRISRESRTFFSVNWMTWNNIITHVLFSTFVLFCNDGKSLAPGATSVLKMRWRLPLRICLLHGELTALPRSLVPRCRLNTSGRRAFPVAGPTVWNSLPDELRDPACDVDSFKQFFKTILLV